MTNTQTNTATMGFITTEMMMREEMTSIVKLILHPNTERADILVDHNINTEKYAFTRKGEPDEMEAKLLAKLDNVIGISRVQIAKTCINVDVQPVTNPSEWVPATMQVVKEYLADYYQKPVNIVVQLDERRYLVQPKYDNDGAMAVGGIVMQDTAIGMPYEKWQMR